MKRGRFEDMFPRAFEASKVLAGLGNVYQSNLDTASISTTISLDTIRSPGCIRD